MAYHRSSYRIKVRIPIYTYTGSVPITASEKAEHLRVSPPNEWISWKIQLNPDWDDCKIFVWQTTWLGLQVTLFYCFSAQESTGESSFYLVYDRDPQIPTSTILSQKQSVYSVDIDDYNSKCV